MGSISNFFHQAAGYDPINRASGGAINKYLGGNDLGYEANVGKMNDPLKGASPQTGVAPTLAAANQGYQVAPTGASTNPTAGQTYGMNSVPGNVGTAVPTTAAPVLPTAPATSSPTITTGAKATNPYTMALQKQAAGGGMYGQ